MGLSKINRRYGWKPDVPDHRDHYYETASLKQLKALRAAGKEGDLPESVDLRDKCPKVYDQGQLGSCTANAIGGAFEFDEIIQGQAEEFTPSRLFIYYNERVMEGSVDSDAGAAIRDGVKSVGKVGVCPESEWPYDINKFSQKPPERCYKDALKHVAVRYRRVKQEIDDIKHCLAGGRPIVFGFAVYDSFESEHVAKTGEMPMPDPSESLLGGHAVLAVGYCDKRQAIIVRNSWGEGWGDKGYFYMPYEYILHSDLCEDFWTINSISNPSRDAAKLQIVSPKISECFEAGAKAVITWQTVGAKEPSHADLADKTATYAQVASSEHPVVTPPPVYPIKVSVYWAINSWWGKMQSWQPIAENIDNKGSYEWTIPEKLAPDTRYYLRVCSADEGRYLYVDSHCFGVTAPQKKKEEAPAPAASEAPATETASS